MSKKRTKLLIAVLAACGLYAAAFIGTRSRVTMTVPDPIPHTIVFYYFSEHPTANRVLYTLYFPFVLAHGRSFDAQGNIPLKDTQSASSGPYYVSAVEVLLKDFQ